jgi:methylated-DNA-protein-cysteine methyltransferase-like protein
MNNASVSSATHVPRAGSSGGGGSTHERILAVVRRIPRGRVATYGQIAALAGMARQPRLVGYALHALQPGTRVPWHRVVNARGMVSVRSRGTAASKQQILLEREGIRFDERGCISLDRYRWRPKSK